MFDKAIIFKGKHGAYARELAKGVQVLEHDVTIFKTNIELCLVAPIIGVLFNRRVKADKSTGEDTKIMPETVIKYQEELSYIFKVVMLSAPDGTISNEKRMDRAFRYNYTDKAIADDKEVEQDKERAMEMFEEYTLGGIELLHEKAYKNDATRANYLENVYEFIRDFYNDVYNDDSEIRVI